MVIPEMMNLYGALFTGVFFNILGNDWCIFYVVGGFFGSEGYEMMN